jgi:hypothetical protein
MIADRHARQHDDPAPQPHVAPQPDRGNTHGVAFVHRMMVGVAQHAIRPDPAMGADLDRAVADHLHAGVEKRAIRQDHFRAARHLDPHRRNISAQVDPRADTQASGADDAGALAMNEKACPWHHPTPPQGQTRGQCRQPVARLEHAQPARHAAAIGGIGRARATGAEAAAISARLSGATSGTAQSAASDGVGMTVVAMGSLGLVATDG